VEPTRGCEVVRQRLGLRSSEIGQPAATRRAADRSVEAGDGIAVSNEDQSHGFRWYGSDISMTENAGRDTGSLRTERAGAT